MDGWNIFKKNLPSVSQCKQKIPSSLRPLTDSTCGKGSGKDLQGFDQWITDSLVLTAMSCILSKSNQ